MRRDAKKTQLSWAMAAANEQASDLINLCLREEMEDSFPNRKQSPKNEFSSSSLSSPPYLHFFSLALSWSHTAQTDTQYTQSGVKRWILFTSRHILLFFGDPSWSDNAPLHYMLLFLWVLYVAQQFSSRLSFSDLLNENIQSNSLDTQKMMMRSERSRDFLFHLRCVLSGEKKTTHSGRIERRQWVEPPVLWVRNKKKFSDKVLKDDSRNFEPMTF